MGKIVENPTDAGQAVILTTTEERVTGGYFDREGVWHEFGSGGGSGVNNPEATIKVVNNTGGGFPFYAIGFNDGLIVFNAEGIVNQGETTVITKIPHIVYPEDDPLFAIPIGVLTTVSNYTISETVNCEDDEGFIIIDDPNENTSFTITVSSL